MLSGSRQNALGSTGGGGENRGRLESELKHQFLMREGLADGAEWGR